MSQRSKYNLYGANGWINMDTNTYSYSVSRIWIRIRIASAMSDRIQMDIDIINRFICSDMDAVSDVKHPDSNTNGSELL